MSDPGLAPPFFLMRPARQTVPVVLTSPHSGRCYAAEFLAASRLDPLTLRRSEDSFVEELYGAAPSLGAPLLAANFPRAWCDVNREPWELDPAMFADPLPEYVNANSPRVIAGLGTIPRIVGSGETIYDGKLRFAEARARISAYWQPFHDTLRGLIEETLARFACCLLIDCHSMPSNVGRGMIRPEVILGDGHGTSCSPALVGFMQRELSRLGFHTRRNDPYAGGYITRHYGRPRDGVQVVQLELARELYMDELAFSKTSDFTGLQQRITLFLQRVFAAAAGVLGSNGIPAAAE